MPHEHLKSSLQETKYRNHIHTNTDSVDLIYRIIIWKQEINPENLLGPI